MEYRNHRIAKFCMLVTAIACYLIQGVVFNLLFPWVISPLIVAWLWLNYLSSHGFPGARSALAGFILLSCLSLLLYHIAYLFNAGVNQSMLFQGAQVFVVAPLYAFAFGLVGALTGYIVSRLRGW